jgi:hypothetical protein
MHAMPLLKVIEYQIATTKVNPCEQESYKDSLEYLDLYYSCYCPPFGFSPNLAANQNYIDHLMDIINYPYCELTQLHFNILDLAIDNIEKIYTTKTEPCETSELTYYTNKTALIFHVAAEKASDPKYKTTYKLLALQYCNKANIVQKILEDSPEYFKIISNLSRQTAQNYLKIYQRLCQEKCQKLTPDDYQKWLLENPKWQIIINWENSTEKYSQKATPLTTTAVKLPFLFQPSPDVTVAGSDKSPPLTHLTRHPSQ